MQGGAFRLPNGNTLITEASDAHILEIAEDGNIVWDYTESGNNVLIARAQKYSLDYFDDMDDFLLGDVNGDGEQNILDIILIVNQILSNEYDISSDLNGDGVPNVLDIVLLVNLVLGGNEPGDCSDVNGDGILNVLDIVLLVNIVLG